MSEGQLTGDAAATTTVDEPASAPRTPETSDRAALVVFCLYLTAAAAYLLWLGRDLWFFADEWHFVTQEGLPSPLINHNGHWVFWPAVAFRALFTVFGASNYLPYLALAVLVHVLVVCALRILMRRLGVDPWPATITAATLMMFGATGANFLFAFQITLTLPVLLGLVALIAIRSDGPWGRGDALAAIALGAAVMCSGVGLVSAGVAFLAAVVTRGWRLALAITGPAFLVYGLWRLRTGPSASVPAPSLDSLPYWIVNSVSALWRGSLLLLIPTLIVLGAAAVGWWWRYRQMRDTWFRASAIPLAMTLGAGMMIGVTWLARGGWVINEAGSERYSYVIVALLSPLVAIGLSECGRRTAWTWLPLGLLAAGIVAQSLTLRPDPFQVGLSQQLRRLFPAIAASPLARQVPTDVQPDWGTAISAGGVTVGWLLGAAAAGQIPSPDPGADLDSEVMARLAVSPEKPGQELPDSCRTVGPGDSVATVPGQLLRITDPAQPPESLVPLLVTRTSQTGARTVLQGDSGAFVRINLSGVRVGVPAGAKNGLEICT